jgi:hypothetical integral membrane protein (TIGR02206 family)
VVFSSFQPFSGLHAVVVLAAAACAAFVTMLGIRRRGTASQRVMEKLLALFAILAWIVANGYSALVADRLAGRIPFHITDILGIAAPAAMLWPAARVPRALLYYWGLALGTLAFITPDLHDGPAKAGFWLFFAGHVVILVAAIYDLAVRRYRPGWGDLGLVILLGLLYVACAVPLNLLLDANYGYLGRHDPGQPTALDVLPEWPWRIVFMVLLGIAAMVGMTVPWNLARSRPVA